MRRPRSSLSEITLVFLTCMASACQRGGPSASPIEVIAKNYPKVDGSTSTHPMSVLVACKIRNVPYCWEIPPAFERTVVPKHIGLPFIENIEEKIHHTGTHTAYENLISRKVDLILVAREPSTRELDSAAKAGVVLAVTPIALDALVFVANVKNPVTGLSLDQVRTIFGRSGALPKWSEVGGGDGLIEPFQRETDSGSQELIEKLVMQGRPMRDPLQAPLIFTMGGVVTTVAMRERAVAFSIYYYVTNMAPNKAAKMLAIDGVKPSSKTIATRSYPLVAEVFVVIRKGMAANSPAVLLRDWLLTDPGRQAIHESGYVPIDNVGQLGPNPS